MRRTQHTRWATLGQLAWADALADALRLTDFGGLTRTALARCLLVASALRLAVSAVARRLAGVGRETARRAIASDLPTPDQLEDRLAAALRRHVPRAFRRRPVRVAIDTHHRPFYGDPATPGVTGGKARDGARWFWSYATAVALTPGHRHTLGLTRLSRGDGPVAAAERLLAQLGRAGVRVRYVLLDRAFYAAAVVNALTRRRIRFVIPLPRRGAAVGRFFRRGCSGWFDHAIRCKADRSASAAVRVAVVPGPDGRCPLVFACSAGFDRVPGVALAYRRRFGIETSYRQLGECLARTSGTDPSYRLLLVGVSLLIREWWVASGTTLGALRWNLILLLTPPAPDAATRPTQPEAPPIQPNTA